jgi:hypothetical protein
MKESVYLPSVLERNAEYHFEVRHDTNGTHTEIYWAHNNLDAVQCLKMYQLLQYT